MLPFQRSWQRYGSNQEIKASVFTSKFKYFGKDIVPDAAKLSSPGHRRPRILSPPRYHQPAVSWAQRLHHKR
jgi:hypothetical protein